MTFTLTEFTADFTPEERSEVERDVETMSAQVLTLAELRESLGRTQAQLADALETSQAARRTVARNAARQCHVDAFPRPVDRSLPFSGMVAQAASQPEITRMDTVSAEHFVQDQVPRAHQALFPPMLRQAYDAADALAREHPILQVASAVDNRGRLRQWAVDLAVERLITSGQWPVDYRWAPFEKPTGRYLEARLSHATLSISQVADPAKQPRNVSFRQNSRLSNEPFLPLPEFDDERRVRGLPGLLLVHGHQDLNFAHVGMPHALHHREYIYRTPNLMDLPHFVSSGPPGAPPPERTDFEAQLTLKAEIEKWRRDHGA